MKDRLIQFLRKRPAYMLGVAIPTLILLIYHGLIASDRYVSDARIIVERDAARVGGLDLGLLSLGGAGGSGLDVELVKRFIESPAMLDHLDRTLQLRAHYTQDGIDRISRLAHDASREDFFAYYLKHVDIHIDEDALTLDLAVQGFQPAFAQRVAVAVVQRSEQFVNEVGQSLAREQVAFAQGEVEKANERLFKAANVLIEYQNEHELLSPELETAAVSQVIAGLQTELARQRTEMKALQSYLSPAAPEMVTVRSKISALERQIGQERAKQVRSGNSAALNALLVKYKELELTVKVATDIYQAGLATLEAAKLDASRKVKHLVMVSAPTLPQESTRPRRAYGFATAAAMLHILYLIGGMILAIVQDHRE